MLIGGARSEKRVFGSISGGANLFLGLWWSVDGLFGDIYRMWKICGDWTSGEDVESERASTGQRGEGGKGGGARKGRWEG